MNKGFTSILFLLAVIALVGVAGYLVSTEEVSAPTLIEQAPIAVSTSTPAMGSAPVPQPTLLQDCPETWYDNRMPMVVEPGQPRPVTQYFIYKGERHELAEFDMDWVSVNCQIEPSAVY